MSPLPSPFPRSPTSRSSLTPVEPARDADVVALPTEDMIMANVQGGEVDGNKANDSEEGLAVGGVARTQEEVDEVAEAMYRKYSPRKKTLIVAIVA